MMLKATDRTRNEYEKYGRRVDVKLTCPGIPDDELVGNNSDRGNCDNGDWFLDVVW